MSKNDIIENYHYAFTSMASAYQSATSNELTKDTEQATKQINELIRIGGEELSRHSAKKELSDKLESFNIQHTGLLKDIETYDTNASTENKSAYPDIAKAIPEYLDTKKTLESCLKTGILTRGEEALFQDNLETSMTSYKTGVNNAVTKLDINDTQFLTKTRAYLTAYPKFNTIGEPFNNTILSEKINKYTNKRIGQNQLLISLAAGQKESIDGATYLQVEEAYKDTMREITIAEKELGMNLTDTRNAIDKKFNSIPKTYK
ncbi:MAG: hypothetical protein WC916_00350 [Candidatus Woesearchaeota archaeon]